MHERAPDTGRDPLPRRLLIEELVIVLALSLLASAVFAILDLISAPVKRSVAVATFPTYVQFQFLKELFNIVFALAPVALVFYLLERTGEGPRGIGFDAREPGFDVGIGILLAITVGGIGYALYRAAIALNVNRIVIPVPPEHHWWTIPILVLGAFQFALLEETVVCGYLITRLQQLRFSAPAAVVTSAVLRGSYHLYQGWGGFAGNLTLGLFFGTLFIKWRRTWPLVIAHFLVDTAAGIGYIANHHHLPSGIVGPILAALVGVAVGAIVLFRVPAPRPVPSRPHELVRQ
jgi:membrane protease YdiL (CAAX protease family)